MLVCVLYTVKICIHMLRLMNESITCVALGRLLDLFINRKVVCDSLPESSQTREGHTRLLLRLVRKPVGQLAHFFHLLSRGSSSISLVPSLFIALLMVYTHTHMHTYTLIWLQFTSWHKARKKSEMPSRLERQGRHQGFSKSLSFLFLYDCYKISTLYRQFGWTIHI